MIRALLVIALLALAGGAAYVFYHQKTPPSRPDDPPPPPAISDLPVTFEVDQRKSEPIPGTAGDLVLSIGDVTRGQAMTSLATQDGATVLPRKSMTAGEVAEFRYREQGFRLTLSAFDTALVGTDSATFTVTALSAPLSESQKIEKLIRAIETLDGAVFIRNGDEHDAPKAASHLRRKWNAAGDRVKTAEDFIDGLATESSMSGRPYEIRLADGTVVPSRAFLQEQLARIEHGEN